MRVGASALGLVSLWLAAAPAQAAIIGTCTINVQTSGTLSPNPTINVFGSTQAGGSAADFFTNRTTIFGVIECESG